MTGDHGRYMVTHDNNGDFADLEYTLIEYLRVLVGFRERGAAFVTGMF